LYKNLKKVNGYKNKIKNSYKFKKDQRCRNKIKVLIAVGFTKIGTYEIPFSAVA